MELTVECQKRPSGSKPNALRRQGLTPAVLYGHNGTEAVELTLNTRNAESLVKRASVNNTIIRLNVPEISWSGKTLLREVQSHPWRGSLYHLSFFSVGAQSSIEVTVPLVFVGDAVGVKQGDGTLDTVLTELEVVCSPDNVPDTIEIDVSELNVGDMLQVDQLVLPSGTTVVGEGERVVVSVLAPRVTDVEAEEAETAEAEEAE